jgi:hypothetical protein
MIIIQLGPASRAFDDRKRREVLNDGFVELVTGG